MNKFTTNFVILLIGILIFGSQRAHSQTLMGDTYSNGLALIEEGQIEEALGLWLHHRNLSAESEEYKPDPRIGFKFIEVVVDNNFTDYYSLASDVYFWGLSGSDVLSYKKEIQYEIERLDPLLGSNELRSINTALSENDPSVYSKIANFWQYRDYRPATRVNERLLEHWERIKEARERFTFNSLTAYDTDPRGEIFVKYGEPDRVLQNLGYIVDEFSGSAMRQTSSSQNTRVSVDSGLIIWIYKIETGMEDEIPFFFGRDGDLGGFNQLTSPVELIPNVGVRGLALIGVGDARSSLIQKLYRRLAELDPLFSNQFYELEHQILSAELSGLELNRTQNSSLQRIRAVSASRSLYRLAPESRSSVENSTRSIEQVHKQYRFLDENNDQYNVLMSYVDPYGLIALNMARDNLEESDNRYQAKSVFTILDKNNSVNEKLLNNSPISFIEGADGNYIPHLDYFIYQPKESYNYRLNFELSDTIFEKESENKWTNNKGLLALSNKQIENYSPLTESGEEFVFSDLMMGYVDENNEPAATDFVPFYIPKNHEFVQDSRIFVRYELYNLTKGSDGKSHYDIDVRIDSDRSSLRDLFGGNSTHFTLGISNELNENRSHNIIEIVTRELDPGKYKLLLEATDKETGEKTSRNASFTILDMEEQINENR